jgi:rubrerythrin
MNQNPNTPVPELAGIEIHGVSRSAFLVRGALASAAVFGAGAVSPFVRSAMAMGAGDVDIVNFALTLEYLETAFYAKALKLGLSPEVKKLAQMIEEDESQHVSALTATAKKLGGTPAAQPMFTFPIKDEKSFLKLAQTLEDTGVGAYNGAAPQIKTPEILSTLGAIVQTESRHSASLRMLAGQDPAPAAFDKPIAPAQVAAKVKPFAQQQPAQSQQSSG